MFYILNKIKIEIISASIYTNGSYHNVNIMKLAQKNIHKTKVKRNQESRQFFTLCNLQLVNSTQPNFSTKIYIKFFVFETQISTACKQI